MQYLQFRHYPVKHSSYDFFHLVISPFVPFVRFTLRTLLHSCKSWYPPPPASITVKGCQCLLLLAVCCCHLTSFLYYDNMKDIRLKFSCQEDFDSWTTKAGVSNDFF